MMSNAQRLVTHGYRHCLRRNYLIQLVNDDLTALQVGNSEPSLAAFQRERLDRWCRDGILPRAIFCKLLQKWYEDGRLSSGNDRPSNGHDPVPGPPVYSVDIGLTFEGFLRLESHTQLTDLFRKKAPAYAQGAPLRASSQLGDSGPSAPTRWTSRYQKGNLHAALVVHAANSNASDSFTGFRAFENSVLLALGVLCNALPDGLIDEHWIEQSSILRNAREVHFGYVDGLSAPRYHGISTPLQIKREAEFNVHQAGELLLGYGKNDKSNPWLVPGAYVQPSMPTSIRGLPPRTAYGDFFKDGSFGVLRNMQQDVAGFEGYVAQEAGRIEGRQNSNFVKAWLKAKILGRWPNGEPVKEALANTTQNTLTNPTLIKLLRPVPCAPAPSNNFGYHQTDPQGLACPFGAHVRRMNPRDDPVVPILRRPLLRRGVPYGKQFVPDEPDGAARGMLGLFFCSSIEEQFEHVLGNWSNNNPMGLPNNYAGKDPLVGNQEDIGDTFEIPQRGGVPLLLKKLPVFVQTRGTCYAFFPSVKALQKIARGALVTSSLFLDEA